MSDATSPSRAGAGADRAPTCRFCTAPLTRTFVDLGMSPLCESFLPPERLDQMEPFYPLHVRVCESCLLVQLPQYVEPEEIFAEYAYFSSYSDAWLAHARAYVEQITAGLQLDADSLVVELASNDGYLLQYFVQKGIPVLGIEPAGNVAQEAEARGVPTLVEFFDEALARRLQSEGTRADLIVANNVLAQVPDLNSFIAGIHHLLKPDGVVTIEVPHLLRLIEGNQLDTIYHEHFSYFSFLTIERILTAHGLEVFDVEELWSHGGSLRVYATPSESNHRDEAPAVAAMRQREQDAGYDRPEGYDAFEGRARTAKHRLLEFLIDARRQGCTIAGYGAPGKGTTLLNYCGIRQDLLDYTVDRNPYKHGRYLPGTHIPVHAPERIRETKPDYVLILPWNLRDEIVRQLAYISEWGGRFVVPIPEVEVVVPTAPAAPIEGSP